MRGREGFAPKGRFEEGVGQGVVSLLTVLVMVAVVMVVPVSTASEPVATIDGRVLSFDVEGGPGDWVLVYAEFEAPRETVAYDLLDMSWFEQAPEDEGAVFLSDRAYYPTVGPSGGPEDLMPMFIDWLPAGETRSFGGGTISGYGSGYGPALRGMLFVLGGTGDWAYSGAYEMEEARFSALHVKSGTGLQSWHEPFASGPTGGLPPSPSLSVDVPSAGWLHLELMTDPVAQVLVDHWGAAGQWRATLPDGHMAEDEFAAASMYSYSGFTAVGDGVQPAGQATIEADLVSLGPGGRLVAVHVPGLFDGVPIEPGIYNG